MKVKQEIKAEEKKMAKREAKSRERRDRQIKMKNMARHQRIQTQLTADQKDGGLRKLKRIMQRMTTDPKYRLGIYVDNIRLNFKVAKTNKP